MMHRDAIGASIVAVLLASFPGVVSAQDCNAVPAGPARTDCYIGLSRIYQGQSDVAAGNARVQSDAARLRQVTGASRSKAFKTATKKSRPSWPGMRKVRQAADVGSWGKSGLPG